MFKQRHKTEFGVVHSSATHAGMDVGVAEIRQWHLREGFVDVGYQVVIRRNGFVELGRPINSVGAHCPPRNRDSIGVCLIGGADLKGNPENNFTEDQLDSLFCVMAVLDDIHGGLEWGGHKTYNKKPTACPSFDVVEWIKGYSKGVDADQYTTIRNLLESPEPPSEIPPMITKGSRGEPVKHLQRLLELPLVDGLFGPQTFKALKEYQKEEGLEVDGVAGPNTWKKLLQL